MDDAQAGCLAHRSPAVRRDQALMARVAQLFDLMQPFFGFCLAVFHRAVDDGQRTARAMNTRADSRTNAAGSLKWCGATRQVTRSNELVWIGQRFGGVLVVFDYEVRARRQFARHARASTAEMSASVTCQPCGRQETTPCVRPGGDVECPLRRPRRDVVNQSATSLVSARMWAFAVTMALAIELFLRAALNGIELGHGDGGLVTG